MIDEQIEKAAQEHADELRVSSAIPGALMPMLHDIAKSSYMQGAQKFLSKQTEIISLEEVDRAAEEYTIQKTEQYIPESYGDMRHRRVVERFDSYDMEQVFEDGVNYALGKQEKDADTVIQGWAAVDDDGDLFLYRTKPARDEVSGMWLSHECPLDVGINLFPALTWDSDPIEVELRIKRKDE